MPPAKGGATEEADVRRGGVLLLLLTPPGGISPEESGVPARSCSLSDSRRVRRADSKSRDLIGTRCIAAFCINHLLTELTRRPIGAFLFAGRLVSITKRISTGTNQ